MIGLARQLSGVPAPSTTRSSPSSSKGNSRASSPQRESRESRQEEELVAKEAEAIVRKGQAEADIAGRGGFSEAPGRGETDSVYSANSRNTSPVRHGSEGHRLSHVRTNESLRTDEIPPFGGPQKRTSWQQPGKMSQAELAVANANLLTRLKPFMANPLANTPISAFFYNDKLSRQRTVNTNASGHFSFRAALDFVPTHVRVLASEKLSATEEVTITDPTGVSLISDIDDTIKHSAISAGAREIFRNAFIRDLGDLSIDGVREWYQTLADMGLQIHYVSNSPWQLYPVLTNFFKLAGLPSGSFHLKQYTGMLQGIFEPVAERKKSTLDKLMRDFPERRFILVGDSGEADLEVYTDVVLDNPGRVLGVFIRDVTTPVKSGFFDPSNGSHGGNSKKHSRNHSRHKSGDSLTHSKRLSRPQDIHDDEAELRAAIAASLEDMEHLAINDRKSINPDGPAARFPTERPRLPPRPPVVHSPEQEEDLIDFSDDVIAPPSKPWTAPADKRSQSFSASDKPSPSPPRPPSKPSKLRSPSPNMAALTPIDANKPAPPKPRKPSTTIQPVPPHQPSPLSQVQQQESPSQTKRPPLPERPNTYRGIAKQKVASAYNALPAAPWHSSTTNFPPRQGANDDGYTVSPRSMSTVSTKSLDELRARKDSQPASKVPPPPPPPRRNISSYPAAAARYATNRLSGEWTSDDGPKSPSEPMSKKEEMWKRRWARAKDIMDRQNVVLRSWRVGSDVADVCVRLAEMALKKIEKDDERKERDEKGRQERDEARGRMWR